MDIELHNTLSGKKEKFIPIKRGFLSALGFGKSVRMYNCGPTVYNYAHIGNLRAYIFADTLKRLLIASDYRVKQVINITDVGHLTNDTDDTGEDKIEKARRREHKSAWDIAQFYMKSFWNDLDDLNINRNEIIFSRATDFIKEQISIIEALENKGFTYPTPDGIYFDTSKFPDYGKLGNINLSGIREGERIGVNSERKNPTDFALWKFSPKNEKRDMEWQSPWGTGFPGWHIECSAMSAKLLGVPFDIHTGGIDHIPTHHNNEIAQSEGAFGKKFVNYWLHSAFVNIDGGKMAKSDENFITLHFLKDKNYPPLAYRYFLLGARYSTQINFTWEALDGAANAYKKLLNSVSELPQNGKINRALWNKALGFVSDDLDTPKTVALIWDILKDTSLSPADKRATIIKIDELLGLKLGEKIMTKEVVIPENISKLVEDRKSARLAKDWKKSDELRDEILKLGYEVKDTPEGQKITQK